MTIASFFCFQETYGPLILRRRAARFRKQTNNDSYYTEHERRDGNRSAKRIVVRAVSRPLRLLVHHRVIQIASLLWAFDYGILYIVLSTFSDMWKTQYSLSTEISGLHYIACALGELVASQLSGPMMDYFYTRRLKQNLTVHAESRIPLGFPGYLLGWSGALLYGWAAAYSLHWAVVDAGVFIMLFGLQLGDMPRKCGESSGCTPCWTLDHDMSRPLGLLSPAADKSVLTSDGVSDRRIRGTHE